MKNLLQNYTAYNLWANKKLCETLKNITPEQWDAELKSSFGSIRLTLLHIWDAQIIWYSRLNMNSPDTWPSNDFTEGNEKLITEFLRQSEEFVKFTDNLTESELSAQCMFKDLKGNPHSIRVCDILQHCMNHSTFHRGQIITMLRELGIEKLPQTDYIAYIRELQKNG